MTPAKPTTGHSPSPQGGLARQSAPLLRRRRKANQPGGDRLLIARLAYGVDVSAEALGEIVVYVALGTATLCGAGIAATTVVPDVESASAALPLVAVLLSFISSIFVPVDQLPAWLADVGRIFPLYHMAVGVLAALGASGDTSLRGGDVAFLVAWALGAVIIAARGVRWEPRAAAG